MYISIKKILFLFTIFMYSFICPANQTIYSNTKYDIIDINALNVIQISNLNEFMEFANNCRLDSFSQNMKVVLMTDLNLTTVEFSGIPIFLGHFDGGGHTISGLDFDLDDDYQGLFRHTENSSIISNLNVVGQLHTDNNFIGGIVGDNGGIISNCTFKGVISGRQNLGGIAGKNSGTISNSTAFGGVFGESQLGGIVGDNTGSILQCINNSEINVSLNEFDFQIDENFITNSNTESNSVNITDVGGIAGASTGIIQNSINYANVGYPHIGYNIGGIVGIQSGYVTQCENYGEVLGRKEVGGIVGQFEPYVSTFYAKSDLQRLSEEIDILSDLTSNLSENTKESNHVINSNINALNTSVDDSRVQLETLIDTTEDLVNENIESVNTISVTVANTLDDIVPITDTFDDTTDSLNEVFDYLKIATDEMNNAFQELENVDNIRDKIEGYFEDIDDCFTRAEEHIEETELLHKYLQYNVSTSQNLYLISLMVPYYVQALDEIREIRNIVLDIIRTTEDFTTMLSNSNDLIQLSLDNLSIAFEKCNDVVDSIDVTLDLISDLSKKLSEEDEVVFATTNEAYDHARDSLSDSLESVSNYMEDVNNSISFGVDLFLDDFNAINKQLNVVLNLVIDIAQDVTNVGDDLFEIEDISYDNIASITAGKLSLCNNYGEINGDINIGGISGGVSLEHSFDREDDFKISNSQNSTRKGIAVIVDSGNYGEIIAKKDGVGGIAGIQDFGLILNCISSNGSIESIDGNYIGGIVGNSSAIIKTSYSKNLLFGSDYIGGIAGKGNSIQDCYALSPIYSKGGYLGGILGDIYDDGVLKNNYFVSDVLGGLNGISYSKKAQAINYNDLLQVNNLPEIFNQMYINFYIEDELVETKNIEFGGNMLNSDFPLITEKNGYYHRWEEVDTSYIVSDLKINAEYIINKTTIASEEKIGKISEIFVNGTYTDEEVLVVDKKNIEVEDFTQDILSRVIGEYTISIDGENDYIDKVRYLMPVNNIKIQLLKDDKWVDVQSEIDSKYIIFDGNSNAITFRVLEENIIDYMDKNTIIYSSCLILILFIFRIAIRKKKLNSI